MLAGAEVEGSVRSFECTTTAIRLANAQTDIPWARTRFWWVGTVCVDLPADRGPAGPAGKLCTSRRPKSPRKSIPGDCDRFALSPG